MARVAMYLQDKHEIREGMAYAQYAEQRGFEAVWQAESRLVRDASSAASERGGIRWRKMWALNAKSR